MSFEKEKRKNDERRRGFLPVWAWTLIIGFIIGLIVMGSFASTRVQSVTYFSGDSLTVNDEAIYATATYIVEQATATQAALDAAKP
jgi:hypothetical protein